jgi:hypothetical protein
MVSPGVDLIGRVVLTSAGRWKTSSVEFWREKIVMTTTNSACRIAEKQHVALPNVIHYDFRGTESHSEPFSAF